MNKIEELRLKALGTIRKTTVNDSNNHQFISQATVFSNADQRMLPVVAELLKMKEFDQITTLISIPKSLQFPYLTQNPMNLREVKVQIHQLISSGMTWDQLMMMGVDEVICAAFCSDIPDSTMRNVAPETASKKMKYEVLNSPIMVNSQPKFNLQNDYINSNLYSDEYAGEEILGEYNGPQKRKVERNNSFLTTISDEVDVHKEEKLATEPNPLNHSVHTRESSTAVSLNTMQNTRETITEAKHLREKMRIDLDKLKGLKSKMAETMTALIILEKDILLSNKVLDISSQRVEKLTPVINSQQEELAIINFKISDLIAKKKLISANIERLNKEATEEIEKQGAAKDKLNEIEEKKSKSSSDLASLKESSKLLESSIKAQKNNYEKIRQSTLYFPKIEYFEEYEDGAYLVPSDLFSLEFTLESNLKNPLFIRNSLLNLCDKNQKFLCPTELEGSLCKNPNCNNIHFDQKEQSGTFIIL
jgi:hypothetical protein